MKKNCFKPDSIPELQKKDVSINIGRPSKITPRKPAEQILIEKDYDNLLGHLIIQNETLTQLKKEIEYKLKKLKDEEVSLNLLHKKYNLVDNNKEETEENKNEKHINLFKKARKEWEERKQELINGNYISADDKIDLENYMDNSVNSELTYSLTSNIFSTDDSTFNLTNINTDFSYPNSENESNFNNTFNFNSINDTHTQIDKPFSLSPTDFSLSPFNLDNLENLDALDPNLMNLDIDFDMNLLNIDLPNDSNIGSENINNSITQTVNESDTNDNTKNKTSLIDIDLLNDNNINTENENINNNTSETLNNVTKDINYLEPELSNIMKILTNNTESESAINDNLINTNPELSEILNEIPDLSNTSDSKSISNAIEDNNKISIQEKKKRT